MKDNKYVILHVFQDGLIFKGTANAYDSMQNVENLYYFYTPDKNYKMQNINDERVVIINDYNRYVRLFSDPTIDIIVFHSLPLWNYYLFNYIDDKKYVIWWAWGFDIYYQQGKYPPLIPMDDILKPLTKEFVAKYIDSDKLLSGSKVSRAWNRMKTIIMLIFRRVFSCNKTPRPKKNQKEILGRIDAFYSPLDVEYDMLRESHPSFRAKKLPKPQTQIEFLFDYKREIGNILVNHSLTHSDNHLDVFNFLYNVDVEDKRKFIIPVSYGIGGNYNGKPEVLIEASRFNDKQVMWLTEKMPNKEYVKIVKSASHAVFGVMRQQALGNIFICLRSGVKVYLFKNSIVYKELIKMGYICFTIEDDLTTDSLATCLSEQEAKYNYDIFMKLRSENNPNKCRDCILEGVLDKQN